MKQVPYLTPTSINRHRIKFGRPGDLAAAICVPLLVLPLSYFLILISATLKCFKQHRRQNPVRGQNPVSYVASFVFKTLPVIVIQDYNVTYSYIRPKLSFTIKCLCQNST
jgi:hypothetical protein